VGCGLYDSLSSSACRLWSFVLWLNDASETTRDRGLAPKNHQQEMKYGLSNGHATSSRDPEGDVKQYGGYHSDSLASCRDWLTLFGMFFRRAAGVGTLHTRDSDIDWTNYQRTTTYDNDDRHIRTDVTSVGLMICCFEDKKEDNMCKMCVTHNSLVHVSVVVGVGSSTSKWLTLTAMTRKLLWDSLRNLMTSPLIIVTRWKVRYLN